MTLLPGGPFVGRDTTQALHCIPYTYPAKQAVVYDDQPVGMSPGHYLSLVSAIADQLHRRFEFRDHGPVECRTPLGWGPDETGHQVAEMWEVHEAEQSAKDHGYWL